MTSGFESEPLVSIAIACYDMRGRGAECLEVALASIAAQDYPRIQVVVADHSLDDAVSEACRSWASRLDIDYVRNPLRRGSSSANFNLAISRSEGELVKLLCQDDYLFDGSAIRRTVAAIQATGDAWLVSSYVHTEDRVAMIKQHDPRLNPAIALDNTIGTPSCLTIRNRPDNELFDEELIWLMDAEYYRRLFERFGAPTFLHEVTVVQLLWPGQVTHTSARPRRLRRAEVKRVKARHRDPAAVPGDPLGAGRTWWSRTMRLSRTTRSRLSRLLRRSC